MENFHVLLQMNHANDSLFGEFKALFPSPHVYCWPGNYSSVEMDERILEVQSLISVTDWIIHVDSDEFLLPPEGVLCVENPKSVFPF